MISQPDENLLLLDADRGMCAGAVNKTMDKMGVAMPVPAMPSYFDFAPVFANEVKPRSCHTRPRKTTL